MSYHGFGQFAPLRPGSVPLPPSSSSSKPSALSTSRAVSVIGSRQPTNMTVVAKPQQTQQVAPSQQVSARAMDAAKGRTVAEWCAVRALLLANLGAYPGRVFVLSSGDKRTTEMVLMALMGADAVGICASDPSTPLTSNADLAEAWLLLADVSAQLPAIVSPPTSSPPTPPPQYVAYTPPTEEEVRAMQVRDAAEEAARREAEQQPSEPSEEVVDLTSTTLLSQEPKKFPWLMVGIGVAGVGLVAYVVTRRSR